MKTTSYPWRLWRGMVLFIRSLQAEPISRIEPQVCATPEGHSYEVYEPKGRPWKTVVPVYGMGLLGERDPRLYKFIQACLEAGTRVAVPNLPGIKSYELRNSDLETFITTVDHIHSQFGGEITLVAFSAGASISMSAASTPGLAGKIKSALLFSPLYDIREVWNTLHHQDVAGADHKTLDNALWTQYVIAYRNRDRLGFSENEKTTIETTLRQFDFGVSDEQKLAFYEQVIAPKDIPHRNDLLMEDDAFDVLSPRGKLPNVHARVAILHDQTDTVVPPSHGRHFMDELLRRPNGQQLLLVTPLLAHVTVQAGANLMDVYKLIEILGEVFV